MRKPCTIDRVLDDGGFELTWQDSREKAVAVLVGVRPVQPLPTLYREILERVARTRRPAMAEQRGVIGDRLVVHVEAFGGEDKSGDVWLDVAPVLLRDGVATVAPGDFPERAEYERAASRP